MARDLLSGPVAPLVLRLSLPCMGASLASAFATLLDALILAGDGAQRTAAVAVSFPLLLLIQALGFTLGIGAGSFVSRSIGGGDKPAAYAVSSTAFFAALALSLVLGAAGFALSGPLVRLLGASDALLPDAAAYARYVLLCAPLLCANLVLSSLLRAQGSSNLGPFSLSAGIGVLLSLLLVRRLRLGLHGAGIALLAREGLLFLLLALSARRGRFIRPHLRGCSFRPAVCREILRYGLPTLLRQGLCGVSSALVSRAAAAFGEPALAGMGLCVRAASLVSAAAIGFGQGFQPVCGQAFGAGDLDRIRAAYRLCMRCVVIALALVGAAAFFLAERLLLPFAPPADVLAVAAAALRAQSALFFAQGAIILMNMLTQALGQAVRASLIACSRQGFVLIPLVLALPRLFSLPGLIVCQAVSDGLSLLICLPLARGALPALSSGRKKAPPDSEARKGLTGFGCARGGCSDAPTASR